MTNKLNFIIRYALVIKMLAAGVSYASEVGLDEKLKKLSDTVSAEHVQAEKLIEEIELNKKELSKEQYGQLLFLKAVFFIYKTDYKSAREHLLNAKQYVTSAEDLSKVYRYQMTASLAMKDYRRALVAAKNQLKVVDNLINPSLQRDVYIRMANFYYNLGAFFSSQRYVNKALLLEDGINSQQHCLLNMLSAANSLKIEKLNLAKSQAETAISYCREVSYDIGLAISYRVFGELLLELSELQNAENSFLTAIDIYTAINFKSEITVAESFLAEINFLNRNYDKAGILAHKVVNEADNPNLNNAKTKSYQVLSHIHSQEGNYKQAFEASKQARKYQQLIYDDEKIKTLAYEAAKFDVEELEDFIQKNENTAYISSGRELKQIDKEMDLIHKNTILQYLLLLFGTAVFTSTYIGVCSYRRNRYNKLTGLMRHDAAMRKSRDFFHDAMYRKNGFAVISLDVDQLKDISRILGHERADWVLTVIADAVKKYTRFKKAYGCYRGGGSFYVYMELKQDQDAIEMAQQLIEHFDGCNTAESLKLFKMTASAGIASIRERLQGVNEKEIIRRADIALHVAKEYSGNEIIQYQESFDTANEEHKKQMQFVQFIDPKLMVRARTL